MRIFAILLCLSACASPSPQFFGAQRHDLELEGIRFTVFHRAAALGDFAEVVRMGYLRRDQRAPVQALMVRAAEEATGCRAIPGSFVTRLPGDTGEARLELSCPLPDG